MEMKEILRDIKKNPTVPVWPHAGRALGVSRSVAYQLAKDDSDKGKIDVIRFGRTIRAISAPLRKRLGIETVA